jgi:membrane dipeptidase
MRLIIDSHLDLAWNALFWNRDLMEPLATLREREAHMTDHRARGRATVSLPEMRAGGVALCLGTILARTNSHLRPAEGFRRRDLDYGSQDIAHAIGQGQLAYYKLLNHRGSIKLIQTADDLRHHWAQLATNADSPLGLIVAMEGADPIVTPAQAEEWFGAGLRVVGLAHYGPSAYAVGTGATGPLTTGGIELLREMKRLRMILDLTHCCDESFHQALDVFDGPILASHNNCRALVPGDRQFSDEQIRLLIARNAVIGVALDAWMLYPNWKVGQTDRAVLPLSSVADHIDHMCQLAGNSSHVGIGSDLDGGFGTEQTPTGLDSIADLQKLDAILASRGYSHDDIAAVFHGNWLRFFISSLP